MTFKYKAKSGQNFTVPGVGQSTNGILETEIDLSEAPSLELVTEETEKPTKATAPVAAAGAVIGTAPVATDPNPPVAAVAPVATSTPPTNEETK